MVFKIIIYWVYYFWCAYVCMSGESIIIQYSRGFSADDKFALPIIHTEEKGLFFIIIIFVRFVSVIYVISIQMPDSCCSINNILPLLLCVHLCVVCVPVCVCYSVCMLRWVRVQTWLYWENVCVFACVHLFLALMLLLVPFYSVAILIAVSESVQLFIHHNIVLIMHCHVRNIRIAWRRVLL